MYLTFDLGFRNSGACPLRAAVSDEETSTVDLVDDDATVKSEGPSFLMNSNSGRKDNLDGSEGVDESADSPLSKLNIKVHASVIGFLFRTGIVDYLLV